ncbi:MAG: glycoside hydrolase family 3 C-terminal domain-containing protein [Prevotellaceae bacterium]|jgi:beta-glucosidase|nr:glycoside hydrolase family 3 C-terminal domain-containing protein [Prevotellaceae bacterium]
MKNILLSTLAILTAAALTAQVPVYLDASAALEDRVDDALHRMTLNEKVAMLHAQSKFSSPGVPRLGIPENWMSDGPHGIREEVLWDEWYGAKWTNDSCTTFPALTALAATWNPAMAALYGKSIGEEARYRNKNVLLGPGVNIYRTPLNGRNFEYMGEDPFLAATMVVPYVREVQKSGVAACVKHYALNNQELARDHINVVVGDRALHEIYLPAFKAAVQQGKAWAIMGAYNQYRNQHCCHNQYLLNDVLKRDWGFDGVVISDWGGVHSTEQAITNGLDLEFGTWTDGMSHNKSNAYAMYYLATPYHDLLREGKADEKTLDEKVRRVLRLTFRTTMAPQRPHGSFGSPEHSAAGRKIAEEGIVLLQNNSALLPVELAKTKHILVVGENATKRMTVGGGSSSLKSKYEISPLEGIQKRVGSAATVSYVQGYASPAAPKQDANPADVEIDLQDLHTRLAQVIASPGTPKSVSMEALPSAMSWLYGATEAQPKTVDALALRSEAVAAAKSADIVLFIGGLNKNGHQDCEGNDRQTLSLPYEQDALIAELVKANPRTVVVIISGNAVAMPWVPQTPAIVEAWYSGTEAGSALAAVLFGDVNPSGKLPFTFPLRLQDNSAHHPSGGDYPGDNTSVSYNDDIFVGYRWHEKQNIKPLFPFGHGLSYTTFAYGKPAASKAKITASDSITITLTLKNTGTRAGAEVVQLYISDKKSSLPRPAKELKGFQKVYLKSGEQQTVSLTITPQALSFYDPAQGAWTLESGEFEAHIGASAADVRGSVKFVVE